MRRVKMFSFKWYPDSPAVLVRREPGTEKIILVAREGHIDHHPDVEVRVTYQSRTGLTGAGFILAPADWKIAPARVIKAAPAGHVFNRLVALQPEEYIIIVHPLESDLFSTEDVEKKGKPCRAITKNGEEISLQVLPGGVRVLLTEKYPNISPTHILSIEVFPNVWRIRILGADGSFTAGGDLVVATDEEIKEWIRNGAKREVIE